MAERFEAKDSVHKMCGQAKMKQHSHLKHK